HRVEPAGRGGRRVLRAGAHAHRALWPLPPARQVLLQRGADRAHHQHGEDHAREPDLGRRRRGVEGERAGNGFSRRGRVRREPQRQEPATGAAEMTRARSLTARAAAGRWFYAASVALLVTAGACSEEKVNTAPPTPSATPKDPQ